MRKRILKILAVLLALIAGCATADARPVQKNKTRRPRLNLPRGWTWPPSPEMEADGKACLARLTQLGVDWEEGPATPKIATPIVLPRMAIRGVKLTPMWQKGTFPMDCHLALAFAEKGAA